MTGISLAEQRKLPTGIEWGGWRIKEGDYRDPQRMIPVLTGIIPSGADKDKNGP
jgi:hypothetical protein